jgi:chromosome segregation ATPase
MWSEIMAKNGSQRQEDIGELLSRLDWLDEERRKVGRRLGELEQGLNKQQQAIEYRDQRILELETQLSKANLQLAKLSNFDIELEQFKDEIVLLIEQYDQRRVTTQDELEKLRRVEHEVHLRDLATIRKNLTPISRLEEEMTLRQAEEARLAKLIGGIQAKVTSLQNESEMLI